MNPKVILTAVLLAGCCSLAPACPAQAVLVVRWIAPIAKSARCLSIDTIEWLAETSSRPGGTKVAGKWLAARSLPDSVLEDTYLRIAIRNRHISRTEGEEMFQRLNGTPGFRATLRKVSGSSPAKSSGHLNELRLASEARQNQMKVLEIGRTFRDPAKMGPTDIDLVIKHRNKTFAIEAKDYLPGTPYPLDKFRADMQTLKAYQSANSRENVIPVFSISSKPSDPAQLALVKAAAKSHDVHLIFGNPQEQAAQIKALADLIN